MAAAESSISEDRTCPQRHSRSNAINGIEADPWNRREIQSERKRVDSVAGDDGNAVLNREKSWRSLRPDIRLIPIDRWRMDIVHGIGSSVCSNLVDISIGIGKIALVDSSRIIIGI